MRDSLKDGESLMFERPSAGEMEPLIRRQRPLSPTSPPYEEMPWTLTEQTPVIDILSYRKLFAEISIDLTLYAIPAAFCELPRLIFSLSLIFLVGRLDTDSIAAFGYALSLVEFIAIGLVGVFTGYLNTLLPQSYGADRDDPNYVVVYVRTIISLLLVLMIVAIFFIFSGPLLLFCGVGKERAELTSMVLRCMVPGVIAMGPFRTFPRAFLYRKLIVAPMVPTATSQLLCSAMALLFNRIFPNYVTLVIVASLWSFGMVITVASQFICFVIYREEFIRIWPWKSSVQFNGHTVDSLFSKTALRTFLRLTSSSILLRFSISQMNLTLLFGTYASTKEAAAAGIALQIHNFLFYWLMGMLIATCYFVGREIGAHRPQAAKRAACCCMVVALIYTMIPATPCLLFSEQIARLFDHNVESTVPLTLAIIAAVLHLISMTPVLVLSYLFIAVGRQHDAGLLCLSTVFLLGLPLDVFLGINLGGYGFYIGSPIILVGITMPLCIYWLVFRVDWRSEADRAN